MELIRLSNAQLAFGTNPILDNTNFQLNQNERVVLLAETVLASPHY